MPPSSPRVLRAELQKLLHLRLVWAILAVLVVLFVAFTWHYSTVNWHRRATVGPHATLAAFQLIFFSMVLWPFGILTTVVAVFYTDISSGMLLEQYFRVKSLPTVLALKLLVLFAQLAAFAVVFSTLAALTGALVPALNTQIDFTIDSYSIWRYVAIVPSLVVGALFLASVVVAVLVLTKNVTTTIFASLVFLTVAILGTFGDYFGYNPFVFHGSIPNGAVRLFSGKQDDDWFVFLHEAGIGLLLAVGVFLATLALERRRKILG